MSNKVPTGPKILNRILGMPFAGCSKQKLTENKNVIIFFLNSIH